MISEQKVNELKKNSRGVKGISLDKGDKVAYATVVDQTEEYFSFDGKKYNAKKVRNRRRGAKGQRANLK